MFESSILRFISVLLVMAVVGFGWYPIGLSRLRKKGLEESKAKSQAQLEARKYSVVGAFLYMVAMVSVVGLFL